MVPLTAYWPPLLTPPPPSTVNQEISYDWVSPMAAPQSKQHHAKTERSVARFMVPPPGRDLSSKSAFRFVCRVWLRPSLTWRSELPIPRRTAAEPAFAFEDPRVVFPERPAQSPFP